MLIALIDNAYLTICECQLDVLKRVCNPQKYTHPNQNHPRHLRFQTKHVVRSHFCNLSTSAADHLPSPYPPPGHDTKYTAPFFSDNHPNTIATYISILPFSGYFNDFFLVYQILQFICQLYTCPGFLLMLCILVHLGYITCSTTCCCYLALFCIHKIGESAGPQKHDLCSMPHLLF